MGADGGGTPRFVEQSLTGWGMYPVARCRVYRPERQREVETLLATPVAGGLIARGLGRAYGDACVNDGGGVIVHDRLNRIRSFDPETGVLGCEAGVSIGEIIETMLPRGWFVPVAPGTRYVTIGGAIASDIHGKNHHLDGSISSFIEEFTLRVPAGETITCSRDREPDVFWATLGGMGLTGVILDARLRLVPVETAWVAERKLRAPNLDAALACFAEAGRQHRYSVAWIDCITGGSGLGRSVVMFGDHAAVDDLPPARAKNPLQIPDRRTVSVPFRTPGFMVNSLTMRAFNSAYFHRSRPGSRLVEYDRFFQPLDSIFHWNRCYGRRGFVQYQLILPTETARDGLTAALKRLARARAASFLAVLKQMGPADDGLLSFGMEGWTLALDIPRRRNRMEALFRDLDAIVIEHQGRVYLAKDATLTPEAFEKMYPGADRFRAIRRRLDPEGRLTSSLARRIGLVAERPA